MSKKIKVIARCLFLVVIIAVLFFLHENYIFKYRLVALFPRVFVSERIDNMDYILTEAGERIELLQVVTIEPAFWKGSFEGSLFYNDGTFAAIRISHYGDFFGIEGESHAFSDGILYQYKTN